MLQSRIGSGGIFRNSWTLERRLRLGFFAFFEILFFFAIFDSPLRKKFPLRQRRHECRIHALFKLLLNAAECASLCEELYFFQPGMVNGSMAREKVNMRAPATQ